ncbi:hypothetical protein DICPUDRAFT_90028 [Dictyostelium purpureum]|uniref:Uncharacterized protein n=1 Tax=Dictyostelium purpureum TaxID=5786 RepID=F0ZZV4_DICPU|nr:uncharacterized protein DICPUDRAFT_90028 [Dictyostelium purpureum]EGC30522.1 hypothetical protein DICPUDRAFT_90028 [Dictyostelium purpureum]|eukprot:XP_003292945.1 hypothetical protein DICPUDRAFT_90028 [Dictyostelium purpureum]
MKIFLSPFSYVLDKNSIGKGFSIDDINCLKIMCLIMCNQLPKKIMCDVCLAFGYGSNVTNELLFRGNKSNCFNTLFLHEEAKPIIDFFEIVDIDSLKNQFGLYFVKKIKYGAILNLVINLQSSNKELMKKLENNLEELKSLNIGNVLSLIKNTDQSQIRITTNMDMGGIINENIPNYQNLDDLESFIRSFNECSETSTPVAIKLSKIKLICRVYRI